MFQIHWGVEEGGEGGRTEARGGERQRREKESEEKGALHPGVCQAG